MQTSPSRGRWARSGWTTWRRSSAGWTPCCRGSDRASTPQRRSWGRRGPVFTKVSTERGQMSSATEKKGGATPASGEDRLAKLEKQLGGIVDKLSKVPDPRHPNASDVFGTPFARRGEDSMG